MSATGLTGQKQRQAYQGGPANCSFRNGNLPCHGGGDQGAAAFFDGTNVHFTFGIPQGADGATGAVGLPGEVMQVDLNNALQSTLAQTSANTNAVPTLDTALSDPPTLADYEVLRAKVNELILNGRR